MHHDLDALHRDVEEQVRLDDLETLVDQGRGVDGDHRPHRPGRVGQRVLRGHVVEVVGPATAEGPTAGGLHQPAHLGATTAAQALRECAVLAVDGHDLPVTGEPGDHVTADDQR